MECGAQVELSGERLLLLPQRALYWKRRETLVVTDTHFGKAGAFRAAAVAVPEGSTAAMLARLDSALLATAATRLIFLGDFWHAPAGRSPALVEELTRWRERHPQLRVELVLGNHDLRVGPTPTEWKFEVHREPRVDEPFVFAHYPDARDEGYVLAGHLHPGYVLHGRGRQRLRLACFHFGPLVGVLPAFGEFTGLANVEMQSGDRCYVIAENEVIGM